MRNSCLSLLLFTLILWLSKCEIYEARNSDDVHFFIAHNPKENNALLFYKPEQEKDTETKENINQIQGIFKKIGEEGRTDEEWVDALDDKVHILRIDVSKKENSGAVAEYKVKYTPLLIILDQGDIQLMEAISENTFEHVKDIYQIQKEKEGKGDSEDGSDDSQHISDEVLQSAKKAADDAKKAATDAKKALKEAKKILEDHLAKDKAEDEKDSNDSKDSSNTNNNKNQDKLQDKKNTDNKNECKLDTQNNKAQTKNTTSQIRAPAGYQVEYLPVLRKIDNSQTSSTQERQSSTQQKYVNHGDHLHAVSS